MELLGSFLQRKRAIPTNRNIALNSESESTPGSVERGELLQQDTRGLMPTSEPAAYSAESVGTAHDDMTSDNEGRAGSESKRAMAGRASQRRANAKIPRRPEPAEQNPIDRHPSSRAQRRESMHPRVLRQPEQHEQGPTAPRPLSYIQHRQDPSDIQQQKNPRRSELSDQASDVVTDMRNTQSVLRELHQDKHELLDKVDSLSADMKNVQSALRELQQDKHELLANIYGVSVDTRNNQSALRELQQDKHKKTVLEKELKETQDKLQETTVTLEAVRKNWKKATSQLGQFRSQGTGLYQIPDSDLTQLVTQLRYDVRNFSIQLFTNEAPRQQPGNLPAGGFWKYMHETTPRSDHFQVYLKSKTSGPTVIQSFLWRLFVGEIFEKFRWAASLHESITTVYLALQRRMSIELLLTRLYTDKKLHRYLLR